MAGPRFRTTSETATRLAESTGCRHTARDVRRLVAAGDLVSRSVGSYHLVHDTAIDAYLEHLARNPEPLSLRDLLPEFPPRTSMLALYRMAARGDIPARKQGQRWVVDQGAWEAHKTAGVA